MKQLKSVFTDDMDHCLLYGTAPVERHHIFGGPNRSRSEKYGFVVPLSSRLHPNGVSADAEGKALDIQLKQAAQEYFENHYGSREEFIKEFGKSYL